MSTLWTPGGERPIRKPDPEPPTQGPAGGTGAPGEGPDDGAPLSPEESAAHMAELRRQLAEAPVEVVIANHAFGLFELAALHLSLQPPQLVEARTAIDALAALVEGMSGRLGEPEPQLVEGLAQLRMVFVQVHRASAAADEASGEEAQ